jgi:hypothetical protein
LDAQHAHQRRERWGRRRLHPADRDQISINPLLLALAENGGNTLT